MIQPVDFNGQNFEALRSYCLHNGTLFEDLEFPMADSSLQFEEDTKQQIEWMRPTEIVENPTFFLDGFSRFDIVQGELGDCWFLSSAANLTLNSEMFERVVPFDQGFAEANYAGIFHFRFWQFGQWVDVVIDDRVPTVNGQLWYTHSSQSTEFWIVLLEKAYAKLRGSYKKLDGGFEYEAMQDFTGGVSELYQLEAAPSNLFKIMLESYGRGSMMTADTAADENTQGLIPGHAYSITKVALVYIPRNKSATDKMQMVRLRNPFGNSEWTGAFSDKSNEWLRVADDVKRAIGLNFDVDGEFWMTYQDWQKHFESVQICHLCSIYNEEHRNDGKIKWTMSMIDGRWVRHSKCLLNLEYADVIDDNGFCTIIVALLRKSNRSKQNEGENCEMKFNIYRLSEEKSTRNTKKLRRIVAVYAPTEFESMREVSRRLKLEPGHYLIEPSVRSNEYDGNDEYLIRVLSEHKEDPKRSSFFSSDFGWFIR